MMKGTTENAGSQKAESNLETLSNGNDQSSPLLYGTFEKTLAVRLGELLPKFDAGFMNLRWLKQGVAAVLASHTSMKVLAPEMRIPFSRKDEKWMKAFLDETSKLLEICNLIREGTAQVECNHLHVKRLLLILDKSKLEIFVNESALWRARNAVIEVLSLFENVDRDKRTTSKGVRFEEIQPPAVSEMLQSVCEKLVPPKRKSSSSRANDFPSAAYGSSLITVLILGALLAAFSYKRGGSGGIIEYLAVSNVSTRSYMWSQSLVSLRDGVKKEVERKEQTGETAWRLSELEGIHTSLKLLLEHIDTLISERGLTSASTTVLRESEVEEAVKKLREVSEHLERGLLGLEVQMRELFHFLIFNRNAVLDCISKSTEA